MTCSSNTTLRPNRPDTYGIRWLFWRWPVLVVLLLALADDFQQEVAFFGIESSPRAGTRVQQAIAKLERASIRAQCCLSSTISSSSATSGE